MIFGTQNFNKIPYTAIANL